MSAIHDVAGPLLGWLETLQRDGVRPREAQARLRSFAAGYPELSLELVWEEEAFDGSLHYDVLVRLGEQTASLSVSPKEALPWPLRGVRRWSDGDLVQVNGRLLKIQDAVGFLDLLWNEAPIVKRVIDVCLLREELERQPIVLEDAALQRGLDAFRRARGLDSAEATHRFLAEHGLTHESLERLVGEQLTLERLRLRLAERGVALEEWLAERRRTAQITWFWGLADGAPRPA